MIRSARYIGIRKRVVRYTAEQWSDIPTREQAIKEAREQARELKGEIAIKVKRGRHLETMYTVRYSEGRLMGYGRW
jgi:hypothetical protein